MYISYFVILNQILIYRLILQPPLPMYPLPYTP